MVTQNMMYDALRYIGLPSGQVDDDIKQQVQSVFKNLYVLTKGKITYQRLDLNKIKDTVYIQGTSCKIRSKDLTKLLAHSNACIVMAATLGLEVDKQIMRLQKVSMLDAVIVDACASVLIEQVCDEAEAEIMKTLAPNEYLTMRFSPGYGDVPLELSGELLEILTAQKRIGLSQTKTHMLVPTKSITAIIGISNQKENRQKSCGRCNLVKTCVYRRRGEQCGL